MLVGFRCTRLARLRAGRSLVVVYAGRRAGEPPVARRRTSPEHGSAPATREGRPGRTR